MRLSHLHFLFLLGVISLTANGLFAQDGKNESVPVNAVAGSGSSVPVDEAYELAIADFTNGKYEEAKGKFESLAKRGLISKELFLNLATTLEKQKQPGESVLWMRRALLIDSGMIEPRQNLIYLKQKLGYLEFSDEGLAAFLRHLPTSLGDWIAMIGLWLVVISLAMAFFLPRYEERRFRPLLVACVAAVFAFGGAWYSQYYSGNLAIENFATVTKSGASALTSPVPGAKAVIGLPPGSEVRILQESGPWTYVEIPGEIRGWLRNEQLAAVWPVTFR